MPTWFLYIGGFSLIVLAAMQMKTRPHEPGDGLYGRFLNVGTLWSMCCIAVGCALLAIALGYWEGPLGAPPPPRPATKTRHRH